MSYILGEETILGLLISLYTGLPSGIFAVVCYVLSAMGLYTIATRRQLTKPWLAWIPVVNCWILGSLSDQYRYVVKGQNRSKRKWLLGFSIVNLILSIALGCVLISMLFTLMLDEGGHYNPMVFELTAVFSLMALLFLVHIPYTVIRFMALYDVYMSVDPANAVLFLVLSIFIHVVEPFFLFFNREKDTGMPPRREQPVAPPAPEPWDQEDRDYL